MFKPVGALLKEMPSRSKAPGAILALQVRQVALDSLKKVCADLPAEIMGTIKPASFKNGVLTLLLRSPLVSSELQIRSDGLIKEINQAFGKKIVERLRFRVG